MDNLVFLCNHLTMIRHSLEEENCSVARALHVLGDGWTLLILREAFLGARRFADFEAELDVSKNILTRRLAHLVEHGVLARVEAGKHGSRQEYELTAKGKDLATLLTALRQWGDRWIFGPGQEPIVVVDRQTGAPIEPLRVRRPDGSVVPGKDLVLVPGPGADAHTRARYRAMREEAEAERQA